MGERDGEASSSSSSGRERVSTRKDRLAKDDARLQEHAGRRGHHPRVRRTGALNSVGPVFSAVLFSRRVCARLRDEVVFRVSFALCVPLREKRWCVRPELTRMLRAMDVVW